MIPCGLVFHPAVFAVEEDYQILLLTNAEMLVSVVVDGEEFFDHTNGVRRSAAGPRRVCVPQARLDAAREYTLRLSQVVQRTPYHPAMQETATYVYPFRPLDKETGIHIYQLADTHGHFWEALDAVKHAAEAPDMLLFAGDIPDDCSEASRLTTHLAIASEITGGALPCVYARGNHELRGAYAEKLAEYTPHAQGHTYYTFRLGCVWGVVLDTGEDKPDNHPEYGGTICCHTFRREETAFIRQLAGYDAPGVRYRLVVCHHPFTLTREAPFDIEIPCFTAWARQLREMVQPHLMLSGHVHRAEVWPEGGAHDHKGQPCPVVVASAPHALDEDKNGVTGAAITLRGGEAEVIVNDNKGVVGLHAVIPLRKGGEAPS